MRPSVQKKTRRHPRDGSNPRHPHDGRKKLDVHDSSKPRHPHDGRKKLDADIRRRKKTDQPAFVITWITFSNKLSVYVGHIRTI